MTERAPAMLVLGAGGFIGARLCETLSARGDEVIAFGRGSPPFQLRGVRWVQGDLGDAETLRTLFREGDVVFDLVGTSAPATSNGDPQGDLRDAVVARLRLLDVLRDAPPARLVNLSSGGTVYGVTDGGLVDETAPTNPLCAYGVSKLAVEKYLGLYRHLHGLDYLALRVSNAFGERQRTRRQQGVVAAFMDAAVGGRPLEIWGDGTIVRDYVHVDDVVAALIRCVSVADPARRVINIGSGVGRSVLDVAEAVRRVSGRPLEIRFRPGRKADVPHVVLDTTRAWDVLGWRATVSWEGGLERTYRWFLDDAVRRSGENAITTRN